MDKRSRDRPITRKRDSFPLKIVYRCRVSSVLSDQVFGGCLGTKFPLQHYFLTKANAPRSSRPSKPFTVPCEGLFLYPARKSAGALKPPSPFRVSPMEVLFTYSPSKLWAPSLSLGKAGPFFCPKRFCRRCSAKLKPYPASIIAPSEGYPVGLRDREASSFVGNGG